MPALPKLPPAAAQPISVVLLAREDRTAAEPVVAGWREWLERRGTPFEIILVCRRGPEEADSPEPAAGNPVTVLFHDNPDEEGAALREGLARARNPLVFYTLCRPEYAPADLGRLLELKLPHLDLEPGESPLAIDHVHVMSGFRAGVKMPAVLRVTGWLWRTFWRVVFSVPISPLPGWLGWRRQAGGALVRFFFGLPYHDVLCPFRLFRREILARSPVQSNSAFAHAELLCKANFLGFVLCEEELPLAVVPPADRGDAGAIWRDARQVFDRPDFGPAVLPEPAS